MEFLVYKALTPQSKHIETHSCQTLKCMTSGIAIKCNDGIVLASDSQGSKKGGIKITVDKVFKIHETVGLVGARKQHHVEEVVEYYKDIPINYKTKGELTNYLRKHLFELCEGRCNPEDEREDLKPNDDLLFAPEILIGTKLKDNEFCIHIAKFNIKCEEGGYRPVSDIHLVSDYDIVGTGSGILLSFIKQIDNNLKSKNKGIFELPVEINVGLAMAIISQAKESDLNSGGDTQIGVIDNNGFRKISVNEQSSYYYKMIKCMSKLLNVDEATIKEWLPVSITTRLI